MKAEEAIKKMNILSSKLGVILSDMPDLVQTVNDALEKQIPKKPTTHTVEGAKIKIGNGWWCKDTTVYECPCCNEFISILYDYCRNCGQALDWSDTE